MQTFFRTTTAAALILGAAASPALAQATGTAPDTAADDAPSGIAEIIVTAQRREENLQRAAVAVSAVTGNTLINSGVSDVTNLSRLVPALVAAPNGGSSVNFFLRGVGSYAVNAFAENAVAFNFAGIYVGRPTSPIGTFFDLERIEVVKGPQGTLYGRNATGGAINVLPTRPKLGDIGGNLLLEYGNYEAKKAAGAINIPIGDIIALRVAGQVVDRDGYLSDGYDDEEGQAVRASLLVKPSDRFAMTLIADYFHQGGKGVASVLVPSPLIPTAPSIKARAAGSDPRSVAELRLRFPGLINSGLIIAPRPDGFQDSEFFGVSAEIEADLGFATLTVIPGYRYSKPAYLSYNLGFLANISERDKQMSIEARLSSNGDTPLRYVLGAYFFNEQQQAQNYFEQGLLSRSTFTPRLRTESKAVFGQLTFDLAETFRLVGGARYTEENKSQRTPLRQQTPANPNPPFTVFAGDLSFNKVTWKAGVEWDAAPRSLLYANVATGFKAGGFFISIRNNTFNPETLTAYTIGSKNRFFDNRLQLNIESFYWDYKNQQIGFIGPIETAVGIIGAGGVTVNAGNARMYGVEAELLAELTPADRFTVNLQYLNSKYTSFNYITSSASGAPPRSGCAISPNASIPLAPPARLFAIDCAGRPAVNSPEWSLNAGYEHEFALGADLALTAGARTRLESSRFLSIEYLPEQRQKRYMISDLYLTLNGQDKRWALTGFVNNVADKDIYASSSVRPVLNVVYNALRPPRTYGVRGSINF